MATRKALRAFSASAEMFERLKFEPTFFNITALILNSFGVSTFAYGIACGIWLGEMSAQTKPFTFLVFWRIIHVAVALSMPVITTYATYNKSENAFLFVSVC